MTRPGRAAPPTRVFACTGSVQLITAVAAARTVEREGPRRDAAAQPAPRDVLVIHDLHAPAHEELALSIEAMAALVGRWSRIVRLSRRDLAEIASIERAAGTRAASLSVRERVGLDRADEVYASQTRLPFRRLLLTAYAHARKICYGDGIGINFSPRYFRGDGPAPDVLTRIRRTIGRLRAGISRLASRPPRFDDHVLLLPNLFDERLARFDLADADLHRQLFIELGSLLRGPRAGRAGDVLDAARDAADIVFLLTSNFSEFKRMEVEAELAAYGSAVDRFGAPRDAVLVVKPHPRDSAEKIARLGAMLSPRFRRTVILDDPLCFHLPFEAIFAQLLLAAPHLAPRVLCFSTACLSLELLYGARCAIGFGDELVRRHFPPEGVERRIGHERDLARAVEIVRARACGISL